MQICSLPLLIATADTRTYYYKPPLLLPLADTLLELARGINSSIL